MARRDGFQRRYIDIIRLHILSGQVETNADAARLLGVSEGTIKAWRTKYEHFDREFRVAVADALAGVTSQAFEIANQGSESMIRFILERRGGPAWQNKQQIDHTSNGSTLASILAEHGTMDDDEARERGLIIDNEEHEDGGETGSEIPYYDEVEYYDPDEEEDRDEFDEDGTRTR